MSEADSVSEGSNDNGPNKGKRCVRCVSVIYGIAERIIYILLNNMCKLFVVDGIEYISRVFCFLSFFHVLRFVFSHFDSLSPSVADECD